MAFLFDLDEQEAPPEAPPEEGEAGVVRERRSSTGSGSKRRYSKYVSQLSEREAAVSGMNGLHLRSVVGRGLIRVAGWWRCRPSCQRRAVRWPAWRS